MTIWTFVVVGVIGALLGLTELISRYRDRPLTLVTTASAYVYILVNAAASVVALVLIDRFDWDFGQTTPQAVTTAQVLIAGLGAAALFRSALFVFKVGDENVPVGPNFLLMALLGTADRGVDRKQAQDRISVAGAVMKPVDFEKAKKALVTACLSATANVSADEAADLRQAVDALDNNPNMSPEAKSLVLGLLTIDAVGPEVLTKGVDALGAAIKRD